MREKFMAGATEHELAQDHHVHVVTVRSMTTGRTWRHVEGPPGWQPRIPTPQKKFSDDDIRTIRSLYQHGHTAQEIARKFDMNPYYVWDIVSYRARANVNGDTYD